MNIRHTNRDAGFSLAALMFFLMATSVMITVSVPSYIMQARREREKELIFRGEEYARAIQKYQRTLNLLPPNVDELLASNGTRFLRKAYADPVSGEPWRTIILNSDGTLTGSNVYQSMAQVPTTTSQLNTATAANNTNGANSATTATSANGSLTTNRVTNSLAGGTAGATGLGGGGGGTGLAGGGGNGLTGGTANGNRPATTGAVSPTAAQPAQPQAAATQLTGIVGVGSASKGTGVMVYNKQEQYTNWEFLAQLQQRGNTGGGGAATGGGGGATGGGGGGAAGGGGGGGGGAARGGGGGGRGQ